ncbi:glycoside hydrolase 5 family protein [Flexivirga caeni]|uniref:glycoside hydrolase 5 family protein n=1 Tax=Flexivirga caeni TaxID=2294115 RepID=UPI0015E8E60E|nr:glycosyl hydrolase [Flexivirga caeni]
MTTDASTASRPLRFGANYVPSRGWFYSWLDFDEDAAARDLADLAGLGMDHVRVFPIWPWIQPGRGHLRRSAIDDVRRLVRIAGGLGLDVSIDLVQGHLSSFDFVPSWALTWHRASIFEDDRVRDGLRAYATAMVGELAGESDVFAFTLGNEVNNLWPDNATTIDASSRWAAELVGTIRTHARPDQLVVHSLFDDAFYTPGHPFGAADVVRLGDVSSVHSWVFNGTSAIDGPLGPATTSHAAYLAELAIACGGPDRPVWLQEVGAPLPDIPADHAAEFVRRAVASVAALPQLTGVTWWCSHDIDRSQLDFPEREYDLGLFTVDHQAKPAAHALADAIERARRSAPLPATDRPSITAPANLLADPATRESVAPGSEFHRAWVAAGEQGDGTVIPARIQLPTDPAAGSVGG